MSVHLPLQSGWFSGYDRPSRYASLTRARHRYGDCDYSATAWATSTDLFLFFSSLPWHSPAIHGSCGVRTVPGVEGEGAMHVMATTRPAFESAPASTARAFRQMNSHILEIAGRATFAFRVFLLCLEASIFLSITLYHVLGTYSPLAI